MQGQGGGAPVWSVAIHWVQRLWAAPGGIGQGQPPPMFVPGYSDLSIKQSEVVATCAGLGDSQVKPSCESRLTATSDMLGAT